MLDISKSAKNFKRGRKIYAKNVLHIGFIPLESTVGTNQNWCYMLYFITTKNVRYLTCEREEALSVEMANFVQVVVAAK